MSWVETDFYDLVTRGYGLARYPGGSASFLFLSDIHIWQLRAQMKHVQAQWERLEQGEPAPPREHPREPRPRAARAHSIRADYAQLEQAETARKMWRYFERPRRRPTAQRGPFYIIHLYAGRR